MWSLRPFTYPLLLNSCAYLLRDHTNDTYHSSSRSREPRHDASQDPFKWLDDFFAACEGIDGGCGVTAIAVHTYTCEVRSGIHENPTSCIRSSP